MTARGRGLLAPRTAVHNYAGVSTPAIIAAGAAAAVTAIGVHAARRSDERVRRAAPAVVAFAAGVLVTGALVHLLPHAMREASSAPVWALAGFVSMVLLARIAGGHPCQERDATCEPAAWLAVFGIGLHSFLDGLTYTVAFSAGIVGGATVALGMVLHELPEGVIVYTLLSSGGVEPRRAARIAWLVAGLTTPVGALVALPVLGALESGLRAVLVAIAGGVLLHVGATHLLPQTERRGARWGTAAFALGVAIALGSALVEG